MKKALGIALLSSVMLIGGVVVSSNNIIPAHAEEEVEVVEETVYKFGDVELTLRSDFTFKLVDGEEIIEGQFIKDGDVVTLVVGGEEIKIKLNDELLTFAQYVEEKKDDVKEKIVEFKDTFLVPLLSSVSLASIVSALATAVFAFIRNKKLDKKLITSEEKLAQATEILSTINKVYADIAEDKKINDETKEIIKKGVGEIACKVNEVQPAVEAIEKIKPILKLLVELETKLAKANTEVVTSGAIKDVQDIAKLIKEL